MTSTNPKANIISHGNNKNVYLLANPSIKPYTVLGSEELEQVAARTRRATAAAVGESSTGNG